jgi:hypothetical protein
MATEFEHLPWDRESVRSLSIAIHRRDGSFIDLVRGRLNGEILQFVGPALIEAVANKSDGADLVAAECASALLVRGWQGDVELAADLDAALGRGPTALLKSIPVDLEDLAGMREGDPSNGGGRIDLHDGTCWPDSMESFDIDDDDDEDALEDPDRWLRVECVGSRASFIDMEVFIETVSEDALARRLQHALNGRQPFRRFKDALWDNEDEMGRFMRLSDERKAGRARAWLADQGFRPIRVSR